MSIIEVSLVEVGADQFVAEDAEGRQYPVTRQGHNWQVVRTGEPLEIVVYGWHVIHEDRSETRGLGGYLIGAEEHAVLAGGGP